MKYIKSRTIQTCHSHIDLEPDDYVLVRMNNRKAFALSYSSAQRAILMRLVNEGDLMEKTPFLEITQAQMEDLNDHPTGKYVRITFPAKLSDEVKERLKGLPIIV
jgi:hypothetical protein